MPDATMGREWDSWAQGQTTRQIKRALLEFGFVAVFGGDLGGPLTPGMKRTMTAQQDALRRELDRREPAESHR